ncbi:MAG: hypothetical protein AB1481_02395, partial [Candidatus Omnitrophota bacterium]
ERFDGTDNSVRFDKWEQHRYALYLNPTITNGKLTGSYLGYFDVAGAEDGRVMLNQFALRGEVQEKFFWTLKGGAINTEISEDAQSFVLDTSHLTESGLPTPVQIPLSLAVSENSTFILGGLGIKLGEDGKNGEIEFFVRAEQDDSEYTEKKKRSVVLPGVRVQWLPTDKVSINFEGMAGEINKARGEVEVELPKGFSAGVEGEYSDKYPDKIIAYGITLGVPLPISKDRSAKFGYRMEIGKSKTPTWSLEFPVIEIKKKKKELPVDEKGRLEGLEVTQEDLNNLKEPNIFKQIYDYSQPPIRAPTIESAFKEPLNRAQVAYLNGERFVVNYGKLARKDTAQGLREFGLKDYYDRRPDIARQEEELKAVRSLDTMSLAQLEAAEIKIEDAQYYRVLDNGLIQTIQDITQLTPAEKSRTFVVLPRYETERKGKKALLRYEELTEKEKESSLQAQGMPLYYFEHNANRIPVNYYLDKENNPVVIPGAERRLNIHLPGQREQISFRMGNKALDAVLERAPNFGSLYSDDGGLIGFGREDLDKAVVNGNLYTFPIYDVYLENGRVVIKEKADELKAPVLRYEIRGLELSNGTFVERADYIPGKLAQDILQAYQDTHFVFRDPATGAVFYMTEKQLVAHYDNLKKAFGLGWATKDVNGKPEYILSVKAAKDMPGAFLDERTGEYRFGISLPIEILERRLAFFEGKLYFDEKAGYNTEGKGLPILALTNHFDFSRGYINRPITTQEELEMLRALQVQARVEGGWMWYLDTNDNKEFDPSEPIKSFDVPADKYILDANGHEVLNKAAYGLLLQGYQPLRAMMVEIDGKHYFVDLNVRGRTILAEIHDKYLVLVYKSLRSSEREGRDVKLIEIEKILQDAAERKRIAKLQDKGASLER